MKWHSDVIKYQPMADLKSLIHVIVSINWIVVVVVY